MGGIQGRKARTLAIDARMVSHSGIGTYLRNLLPVLDREDSLRLILLGDADAIRKACGNLRAETIPLRSPIYGIKEQLELPRRVPRCDLFWSPHYNVPLLPILARRRLVTIHDVNHLANSALLSAAQKAYARVVFTAAVRLSHLVITDSEFSKREIVKYIGADPANIHAIPLGVPEDFGISKGGRPIPEPYVLFVGNVKPHKNLKNALLAFSRIAPEYPGLKFMIVGRKEGFITSDDGLTAAMQSAPAGSVDFTGFVDDGKLKDYYHHASLFLFPSIYEGFGLPVLEAMAHGIPIACSTSASLPEVGGDRVEYFDATDVEDMARAARIGLKEWRNPARRDYSAHLAGFRWPDCAGRHMDIIGKLIPA